MLKAGIYIAEHIDEYPPSSYRVGMEVKETEKSYIFRLVDFEYGRGAIHIGTMFQKSDRVVIRKNKRGHAMRVWSDEDFTLYPYQAGKPYYFVRAKEAPETHESNSDDRCGQSARAPSTAAKS